MPRRALPHAHIAVPNLAPMVDVVMVILIFFMLGTSFVMSEGILPTQLPTQVGPGGGASVAIVPEVRIALRTSGDATYRIYVMDQPVDDNRFDTLAAMLNARRQAGASETSPVSISADPDIAYEHVIAALDACARAGFKNLRFVLSEDGPLDAPATAP